MTLSGRSKAKALLRCDFDDQGRRLEDRTRLDTVVVPAVNDIDTNVCSFRMCVGGETK